MAEAPVVFANIQQSGWEALSGAPPVVMNVVIDGRGTVRRRPAIVTYDQVPSAVIDSNGVDGLHVTNAGNIYAVGASLGSAHKVYRLADGASRELPGVITGFERPTFAETQSILVMAASGPLTKVELSDDRISRLGGDPPSASHVVANALRLSANDVTVDPNKVRYSGISDSPTDFSGFEQWSFGGIGLSGFYSAEARPDPVLALGEDTNEVFVFGQTNVQLFTPDPSSVYVPVSTREFGISAPYSVVKFDNRFAWLDHRRRFIVSDGRESEDISAEINQVLQDMTTVSDCFGYRANVGIVDALVWTFPTEGRTYAYQNGAGWCQWRGRTANQTNWGPFTALSAVHRSDTDETLVGTLDGHVGQFQMGVADDLGSTIVAFAETGFLTRDTGRKKQCTALHLHFRRPQQAVGDSDVIGLLSWSDSPGVWNTPRQLRLDTRAGSNPVVTLRSLGIYRKRAWRFEFSSAEDLVLSEVSEEYEVLDQ